MRQVAERSQTVLTCVAKSTSLSYCPHSYLELLGSYKKLLAKRQDEVR